MRFLMIRFLLVSTCAVGMATTALGQQNNGAANLPERVVAKIKLSLKLDGKLTEFAELGDILVVTKKRQGSVHVQTPAGHQGWVGDEYVAPWSQAINVYSNLIKESPKKHEFYFFRAMAYAEKNEKQKEIADYTMAIQLGSKNPQAHINRGVAYATQTEYDKAIADYDAAIKLGFRKEPVYLNRAFARMAKNDAEGAVKDFTKVLELDPDNIFARLQRGVIYQRQQDYDNAIGDFNDVLRRDDKHLGALSSRAFTYFLKGDSERAVRDFGYVIRINPDSGLAYNNRGFNLQKLGKYKEAIADYNKAIEKAPKYALAYQNKAWLLATCPKDDVRNGKEAITTATKACELREWKVPGDIKALAAGYAEANNFDKAIEYQQKVIAMMEGDAKSGEEEMLKLYKAKQPYRFIDE